MRLPSSLPSACLPSAAWTTSYPARWRAMLTTSRSEAESSITRIFFAMGVVCSEKRQGFGLAGSARACAEVVELLVRREFVRHVLHPQVGVEGFVRTALDARREGGAIGRDVRDDLAH